MRQGMSQIGGVPLVYGRKWGDVRLRSTGLSFRRVDRTLVILLWLILRDGLDGCVVRKVAPVCWRSFAQDARTSPLPR
ncbi:hypothetical protein KCP75_01175 [Salmonella enterica subsp. enterica]|nr:hypothetical protein KCP75_01175 [Salmonella enterica subsp. enterica]